MTPKTLTDAINTHGSILAAARALDVSPALVHYYLKKYGLEVGHKQQSLTWVKSKVLQTTRHPRRR